MRYKIIIALIIGTLVSCASPQKSNHSKNNLSDILSFFIDSVISEAEHGSLFLISPEFDNTLDSSYFRSVISSNDLFNNNDLITFSEQYERLKDESIKDYLREVHLNKISNEKPSQNEVYYVISPPLYTANCKHIIIHTKTIFLVEGKPRWDSLTFLFKSDQGKIDIVSYKK